MSTAEKVYNRIMTRNPAEVADKSESTLRHTGVDWMKYKDRFRASLDKMALWTHEDASVTSFDGLKLHGKFFPAENINNNKKKKVAIAFHGYSSDGITNNLGIADYFRREGFSILLPDARAHGKSEGKYIGFGVLDRKDVMQWVKWVLDRCGNDIEILLYGQSMGGATVLMASSLDLPSQVKCIISDSAFTSPEKMLTCFLKRQISFKPLAGFIANRLIKKMNAMNIENGSYALDACNSSEEVKKAKVPILFIHGSADPFVPAFMCGEIYSNCCTPKHKVIFDGAAHIESYYSHTKEYENELKSFTEKYI